MNIDNGKLKQYAKPDLQKLQNIKEITRECANWQCSVTVPRSPGL